MNRKFIIKIESFEGRDTYLQCGNDRQDHLFCIVGIGDDGDAGIVDSGYRSFNEAAQAWPDAVNAKHATTRGN